MRRIRKPGTPPSGGIYSSDTSDTLISLAEASQRMIAALRAWREGHGQPREASAVRTNFFDHLDKARARRLLRAEQHGRCAFCEGLVTDSAPTRDDRRATGMRIAHWVPIEVDRELTLTWSNLFGSCEHDKPTAHCDVFQESRSPPGGAPTPADEDYSRWMRLSADGSLIPAVGISERQLAWVAAVIDLFNLNADRLRSARLGAIKGLQERLASGRARDRQRAYTPESMGIELDRLAGDCPDLPYPTAQRLWLERRRARG